MELQGKEVGGGSGCRIQGLINGSVTDLWTERPSEERGGKVGEVGFDQVVGGSSGGELGRIKVEKLEKEEKAG